MNLKARRIVTVLLMLAVLFTSLYPSFSGVAADSGRAEENTVSPGEEFQNDEEKEVPEQDNGQPADDNTTMSQQKDENIKNHTEDISQQTEKTQNSTDQRGETHKGIEKNQSGEKSAEGHQKESRTSKSTAPDNDISNPPSVLPEEAEQKEKEEKEEQVNGLTPLDALRQAQEQGIDLMKMSEGETITFKAMAGSTEKRVSVTRSTHYEYSNYGLGSYETYKYYVSFGNISATAYCIQPSKSSPDSGTYTITKLSDSKNLAKVCYYGTKASGSDGFFSEKHEGFSEGKRFILVHLAASYANSGSDAFSGANGTARSLAMELYNWCIDQPDIPDVDMSFSDDDVTAYVEGSHQRTKDIRFKADTLQTITFHLPDGVRLHNVSTGKTSAAGADVEISGGTVFYLSAPLSQTADVAASWKTTMKGSVVKDFSAYKISTGGGQQDLALVFGEGVDDEKYIDFHVSWLSLGELTIYKEGEELSSATKTENGVTFHYDKEKQKNAVYNVYAGEDIKDGSGKVIYKEGTLVAGNLKTGTSGSVLLKNLYAGTYTITEKTAPSGFYNKNESKKVKVQYSSDNSYKVTFVNDRQKAEVSAVKQDKETHNKLADAIFGLYAGNDIRNASGKVIVTKDTLIEKATTKTNGKAAFQADLPLGYSYYIKELQAPANYYRNQTDKYTFRFVYTDDQHPTQSFQYTFSNERTEARIRLVKEDKETGSEPQGDAVLNGALYGLFARKDIVHPDGKTGTIYKAGDKIADLVTDDHGYAQIDKLYLGKYYVKELSPSTGYLIDENEYDIDAGYEGDLVKTVERTATSPEEVKKQPFQVIKAADNDKTDADLLSGTGFTAYLLSSLKELEDGSYDYQSSEPVVLTQEGGREMFTDEKGHAVSIPLPYGTYLVVETTTPHNYSPVDPFIVRISDHDPDTPQVWRVLLDDEFRAKLKIIKQDDETGRSVLLPETEFRVFDLDHHSYVNQVTTYPSVKVHTSYYTNEEGYLILPENLRPGNYRIEEVHAPEGYTINRDYVDIKVDTDTMYHIDTVSGDAIIEVVYQNHPVKGELMITKYGEQVYDFDGQVFHYKTAELSGAVYEVYASENIYTPDHHLDINGERLIAIPKDTLVKTVITDENGQAAADNLPLGRYYVKEKTAPEGYLLNIESKEAEFVYAGQDVPVVKEGMEFTNERQKVEINVMKRDVRTEQPLKGAEFGIYNKEDMISCGKTIAEADTLLQTFESEQEGRALCTLDLPLGNYYVKELKAPPGYLLSDTILEYNASYQGQNVETIVLGSEIENEPTSVEISKSDITTGAELSGAKLSVIDREGNVVESWISNKDEPHMIRGLLPGETYILREELAPYGYLKATDVEFTVSDSPDIQKVEMKDEVPVGMIIINKKGEFLNNISLIKHVKGIVEHLFEYVTGNLTEVSFEIYAAEDIKAADGISPDHYKKDQLVTAITTDETGYASIKDLPLGRYYVKETGTAYGHVLDSVIREVDLTYRNQNTPIVVYDKEWRNNRQKVSVNILKLEKGSGRGLEGGIFGLFTKDPIYSASGRQLMEADEIIELKRTGKDGKLSFLADLPIDATYYVKELYAPDGYTITDEKQEFSIKYQGGQVKEQPVNLTFRDEPTTIQITKSDLTSGDELPGAHLKITDQDGKVVDSWISGSKPHIIKKLIVGRAYTLIETKPADGYTTAESIQFTVKNTAKIQKIEMKDDVTKVRISKQDIAGKELPGAKLTVFDHKGKKMKEWISTTKPHYIEMLPIGHYILREETAPDGYLLAEEVKFEIKDTAKIQRVKMIDKPARPTKVSGTPKTGDHNPVGLWLVILGIGISGAVCLYRHQKRRRMSKKS